MLPYVIIIMGLRESMPDNVLRKLKTICYSWRSISKVISFKFTRTHRRLNIKLNQLQVFQYARQIIAMLNLQ